MVLINTMGMSGFEVRMVCEEHLMWQVLGERGDGEWVELGVCWRVEVEGQVEVLQV